MAISAVIRQSSRFDTCRSFQISKERMDNMIPIDQFPYDNDVTCSNYMYEQMFLPKSQTQKTGKSLNPKNEQVLLLRMKSDIEKKFAVGFYDKVNDLFYVCIRAFMQAPDYKYEERLATGSPSKQDFYCIMPNEFLYPVSSRQITHFMPMSQAISFADEQKLKITGDAIDQILKTTDYITPYMVCMKGNRIIITMAGHFAKTGKAFCASMPKTIDGNIYHMVGPIPKEKIQWIVNLTEFGGVKGE